MGKILNKDSEKTFTQQLETLSVKARNFIAHKVDEGEVVFATDEQIDNEEIEISDLPDCAFYDKYGFSDFAAIIRIYKNGRDYFAWMILKDSFNETHQRLNEFSAQELIYLADYINSLKPITK